MSTRQKFNVHLERDANTIEVLSVFIDQRDISALERNRGRSYDEIPKIEGIRWAVWHAGNRARMLLPGWPTSPEEFERMCVEVEPGGDPETVRPTLPAPEAG